MIKARKIFDKNTLLTLYYSFIYPYLNHFVQVWGSTYSSYLHKVLLLQKRVVRIIHGVPRRTHTEPLFKSLCVLTIDKLHMYTVGLFMYKYHNGWLSHIFNMFERNSDIHHYNTRQSNLLHVPKCRTNLGKMAFRYQAVTI